MLRDPLFQEKLALIAIDEAHVVWEWGQNFRTYYTQLVVLRNLIRHSVPWLACSATLDPQTLLMVQQYCGFDSGVCIQRCSIDRPDIFIAVRQIMHPVTTFRDLEFLVEPVNHAIREATKSSYENQARVAIAAGHLDAAERLISLGLNEPQNRQIKQGVDSRACCMKIPKTVVYFDSIATLEAAAALLVGALVRTGCSKTAARNAIQPYHSELATFDKECISREFVKTDNGRAQESSMHRIIMASDAMGMGINNPDIKQVVQWKQPSTLCALWQRAGRAARDSSMTGNFIWFVEPWCCTSPGTNSQGASWLNNSPRQPLPRELADVINSELCIRRSILEFFGEDAAAYSHPSGPQSCCSLCRGDQSELRISHAVKRSVKSLVSQKHFVEAAKAALLEWRRGTAQSLFSSTYSLAREELVLPTAVIRLISQTASSIDTTDTLGLLVGGRWAGWDQHAAAVVDLLQAACSEAKAAKQAQFPQRKRRALREIDRNSQDNGDKQPKIAKIHR